MKAAYLVAALALALPVTAHAGEIDPATVQLWDVVETSDGTVLKGVIVEELPGTSVRVLVLGGSSIVVPVGNVVRFAKELNPGFAAAAAAPAGQVAATAPAAPAMGASSGLRLSLLPGMAIHEELSTLLISSRIGYEIALGRWGLTPGLVIDVMPELGRYGATGGGVTAAVRAAYRGSTVSPFVGFGIGPDIIDDDVSPAITMTAGIELVLHRRFALVAEGRFHRGFSSDTYITTMSYGAITAGAELRL